MSDATTMARITRHGLWCWKRQKVRTQPHAINRNASLAARAEYINVKAAPAAIIGRHRELTSVMQYAALYLAPRQLANIS